MSEATARDRPIALLEAGRETALTVQEPLQKSGGGAQARLRDEWSPEHISGRFKAGKTGQLSTQTNYDFVLADKQARGDLHTHLRSQKKRKKRYGSSPSNRGEIADRVGIEERPLIVDRKVRVGDWEGDLIVV